MATEYYSVLTYHGEREMEAAINTGVLAQLTRFAAGDGIYEPPGDEPIGTYTDENENEVPVYGPGPASTQPRSEKQRGDISSISLVNTGDGNNPTQVKIRVKLDSSNGDYVARELFLFEDDASDAFIVAKIAPKTLTETESGEQTAAFVTVIAEVRSSASVELVAGSDTGVTQDDIDTAIENHDTQQDRARTARPYDENEALPADAIRTTVNAAWRYIGVAGETPPAPAEGEDWQKVLEIPQGQGETRVYESEPQLFSNGQLVAVNHGENSLPVTVSLYAEALNANAGFLAGERVLLDTQHYAGSPTYSVVLSATASQLLANVDDDGVAITSRADSNSRVLLNSTNWRLVFTAVFFYGEAVPSAAPQVSQGADTDSGVISFPGGLKRQWVTVDVGDLSGGASQSFNYAWPEPFSSSVYSSTPVIRNSTGNSYRSFCEIAAETLTGGSILMNEDASITQPNMRVRVEAWGI